MEGFKFAPYSHSKISTFCQCPKQFELKYIQKLKPDYPQPEYFKRGIQVHEALCNHPAPSTNQDLVQFLKTETGRYYDQILRFADTHREVRIGFDHEFNLKSYAKNSLLNGIIDMIYYKDGTVHLVDWKSGKSKTLEQQDWSQLETYAIAFLDRYDVTISYVYLTDGRTNSKSFTKAQRPALIEGVKSKINRIETATSFERNVTHLCNYCQYKDTCDSQCLAQLNSMFNVL